MQMGQRAGKGKGREREGTHDNEAKRAHGRKVEKGRGNEERRLRDRFLYRACAYSNGSDSALA